MTLISPERLKNVLVVIVGFKVSESNSIAYAKLRTPDDKRLGAYINELIHGHKEADFISIRIIREKDIGVEAE